MKAFVLKTYKNSPNGEERLLSLIQNMIDSGKFSPEEVSELNGVAKFLSLNVKFANTKKNAGYSGE
jgi:hypothetical protein